MQLELIACKFTTLYRIEKTKALLYEMWRNAYAFTFGKQHSLNIKKLIKHTENTIAIPETAMTYLNQSTPFHKT